MTLNFPLLTCFLGGAVLFLVWLKKNRSLRGLFWLLVGLVTIYALAHSDGQVLSMLGIVVVVFVLATLLTLAGALVSTKLRRAPAVPKR